MIWPIFEGAVNLFQGFLMMYFMRKGCVQKYTHWWMMSTMALYHSLFVL